jgi:hypothetical protein
MAFELKRGDTLSLVIGYSEEGVLAPVLGAVITCSLYSSDRRLVQLIAVVSQPEIGVLHAIETNTLWPSGHYDVVLSILKDGIRRSSPAIKLKVTEKWQ